MCGKEVSKLTDKERLENLSPTGYTLEGDLLIKGEDYHWLMEQAEKAQELEKEKKYWIQRHKNLEKAVEALKEIALYEGDFYGDEMAQIAKEGLKGIL